MEIRNTYSEKRIENVGLFRIIILFALTLISQGAFLISLQLIYSRLLHINYIQNTTTA